MTTNKINFNNYFKEIHQSNALTSSAQAPNPSPKELIEYINKREGKRVLQPYSSDFIRNKWIKWNENECKKEIKRLLKLKTKMSRENFMEGVRDNYERLSKMRQNDLWQEYEKQWNPKNIEQEIAREQAYINGYKLQIDLQYLPKGLTMRQFITKLFTTPRQIMLDYPDELFINDESIQEMYDRYKAIHKQQIIPRKQPKESIVFPFKSKVRAYEKLHDVKLPDTENILTDYRLNIKNKLQRPSYSPRMNAWQIDYVFAQHPSTKETLQRYLFCININTKFLQVFPTKTKSALATLNALEQLVNLFPVSNISGDAEAAFNSGALKAFYQQNRIKTYFTGSTQTYHNKIVDAAIRTIRNAFGEDYISFSRPYKMAQMVELYNNTPHSAFDNKLTPKQVQEEPELEGRFIREKEEELNEVLQRQKQAGLMRFQEGNVLLIHLDKSKTKHKHDKRRRNFDELAIFIRYIHGNVLCELMEPYDDLKVIELPVYFCKKVANSIDSLPQKFKVLF